MIIERYLFHTIQKQIQENKVLLLYGPRRVGKTTLLKQIGDKLSKNEQVLFVNGENRIIQQELSSQSVESLKTFVGGNHIVIIDEAQHVPNIGLNLKLIVDFIQGIKVIASGSASFDLADKVGEPLTGRKKTLHLYPLWAGEIIANQNLIYYKDTLESSLIFGGYPEVFTIESKEEKKDYLRELIESYLFKDILVLEQVKNPKKLYDLLTLLAFQIGKEVSLSELGANLELHKATVFRYLELLEKAFIILNIRGFSRNLRKEVSKTSRYYFYDNGVRNALINNFNTLTLRNDVGMLWENYIIMERIKKQAYHRIYANNYFWRTYDQHEIDWIEERDGKLYGYEITWGQKTARVPKDWQEAYQNAEYMLIDKNNFYDFIAS